jgi:DNA-binding transcriptional ArsR family regulator
MIRILHVGDKNAQKIASVLTSKTAKKILDYLDQKIATESEIAKDLGISPSTVHYNISLLKECGLISIEGMNYSVKGKEVLHYKLASDSIIIAPTADYDVMARLRTLIPIFILVFVLFFAQFFSGIMPNQMQEFMPSAKDVNNIAQTSGAMDSDMDIARAMVVTSETGEDADSDFDSTADADAQNEIASAFMYEEPVYMPITNTSVTTNFVIWPYLLLGSVLALLSMLCVIAFEYVMHKRKHKD